MSEFDFLKRGVDYLNHNDYQQAIEQFDRALEINPNFAEAYYLRGITHRQMDDTSKAVEDYTQALQIKPNLSEAHTSRASARSNIGDYKGAVEDYTQVLQSNPFDIEAYVNRGLVETRLGNNQAAIEDCTKALRLNPNYASAYVNRGLARSNIGDFNGALKDWTQAVENAPNDAQAYSNRCFVRAELGDPQGALEDCNQALQINPSFDQAYANRGFVRSQLGDYEGAIEDCNQSLQLNPDEPETYYHRATAHYHLGNRQAADKDLKQAAELYFQQGRTDDYHYQAVLDNIKQLQVGAVLAPPVLPIIDETEIVEISISPRQAEADTLLRQGMEQSKSQQFNAAGLELYRQALEIYRENEDDWGKNLSIIELGEAYNSQGIKQYFNREFEAALKSYQTALTLYRESDYLSGKADVLYNLGMAYDIFNRRKKAIEYFQQSLDIARKIGDRHREGRCLGSLGISYLALALEKDNRTNEDYQEALKCYEESLAIAREISDLRGQWLALQSLGNIFILQEQYDSGIDCYQQSLTKARESADLYGEGFALGNIGAVYLSQGNYSKAIEYFQQVLEISRELKEWNTEAINLERLGLALFKSGNLSESENRLRQAIEVYEKTWAGHGQNNLEKTSILDVQQNAYQLLQQVLIARGQIENALGIADRGRARAIADLLARRLSDGQKERVEIIPLTIEQIKNVAKEQNATLVEYTIINDFDGPTEEKTRDSMLFIWVIKPTGEIHFRTIDLKPFLQGYTSTLEKLVSVTRISIGARGQFRKAQVDRAERKAVVDRAERVVRVNELYNILIEPIADLLPIDASDRVIFIPQGPLFLVPFPALKNKSGKYLIEQHTILTATSIKVLELTREHQERVQAVARKDMLVVGNPTMPSISFEVGQKPQKLDPLPGAEKEALAIAPLLNTKALIGNEATKVAIVKRMASSRIIHLATHGLLEDFRKQDVPGAIALAPSATDDGLLTAAEILEFKLNAELVVLSACDTGQGRLTVDGVIGLSRSLIAAGVPSVIVSLWSVPDAATAFLMMEFYQNLQGNLDKAQALRQAMLTTMKKYPDPISWAAFTLIGEANSAFSFSATGKLVVTRAAGYVLNYIASFNEELQQIGQISPQEFAEQYPTHAEYLPQISYDPTTAKFWDEFNLDPEENNNNPNSKNRRNKDFRLNREELAVFKKNGVVVSERLGASSFAELFYSIYNNDLPVFVSADAILHAWHRSYDAMLEELEETYLAQSLDEILESMAQGISECWLKYSNGVLGLSVKDADYFLAVARSLLQGAPVKTQLNQDARVEGTLAAVQRQELQELTLFGRNRQMDFSQFKVRGHYEHSEPLQRYFQAMMWCGRVDLRIAGTPEEASPRELGAAVIFCYLLEQSGKFYQWQQFDEMLQTFVGKTDSMTFAQLDDILSKANIKSPGDIKDLETLEKLQSDILALEVGVQGIRSDSYKSPQGTEKIQLPRAFTVLGQKFVLDSWATSKVVADEILWDDQKVPRLVPSCLDVAFAVLGNNQVVPDIVERIADTAGNQLRDGLNYQHNLAAVRNVIDGQDEVVWEENIYMNWLATLRQLSAPTIDVKYPEVMRTRAWAMKTVNTQLASWTQLRHDTILYAKQSYSGYLCEYPAGFVEPRPEFWERFEKMAVLAADLIQKTPFPDRFQSIQKKQSEHFQNFAQTLAILKKIAVKELAQEKLAEEESKFLKDIVEINNMSGGPFYYGWYPSLFYKERKDSDEWDAIVADVHTNVEPASVLHQAVGNVDMLMIAVDNGEDKMIYAGPVLSHYEFEMPGVSRKSDSEWREDINNGKLPPRPDWTKNYLVSREK
jgi:CHAT domain-containing protein/lipoprotein NlpI